MLLSSVFLSAMPTVQRVSSIKIGNYKIYKTPQVIKTAKNEVQFPLKASVVEDRAYSLVVKVHLTPKIYSKHLGENIF